MAPGTSRLENVSEAEEGRWKDEEEEEESGGVGAGILKWYCMAC